MIMDAHLWIVKGEGEDRLHKDIQIQDEVHQVIKAMAIQMMATVPRCLLLGMKDLDRLEGV